MQNKTIISITFLFFIFLAQAQDTNIKSFTTVEGVYGNFIGKLGLVGGMIEFDDGNQYKNSNCYRAYQDFEIDSWQIEFGSACNSSATIEKFLFDNNQEHFKNYQQVMEKIKSFAEYLYDETINIELTLVFLDGKVMFKKRYLQLAYDKIPMHISTLTHTKDVAPEKALEYYSLLAEFFSHELFHLYNRKIIRKINKTHKKTLKNGVNDEMLAEIVGKCAGLIFNSSVLNYSAIDNLKDFYKKGEPIETAYPKTEYARNSKIIDSKIRYLASFGYAHAEYALWNQFGVENKVRSLEERRDILKYCRYVVQTIPDVEQIKTITPDDYASMPEPDFLATYE